MAHRPLYRQRSGFPWLKILIAIAVVGYALYWAYGHLLVFNPQEIVEKSELGRKNFETKVVEIVSPKGIKAYLFKETTNPIVSVNFLFKNAGIASDDQNESGISNMVAALLTEGAGNYDSQSFKEQLESRAIGMSFSSGKDDFTGSLVTTKEHLKTALTLLKSVLEAPRFDEADIKIAKARMLEVLKRQKEQPTQVLALDFAKFLYGEHPYSRNPAGDAKVIANLSRQQLQNFVKDNFNRNNLVVGIAGDINEIEAKVFLDEVFGNLPEYGRLNFVRNADINFDGRSKDIKHPAGQNIAAIAAKGAARKDEDFYPLFIANHIFGGSGLSSRLSQAIREKEGLTYSIYSYLSLADKAPLLNAGFSSTPDNFAKVVEMFNQEWLKFGEKGASQKELDKAKNYLISSYNLRFAGIDNISEMLVYMQKDNLGLDFLQKRNDYVRQVSLEDVNKAAKKFFNKQIVAENIGSFQ